MAIYFGTNGGDLLAGSALADTIYGGPEGGDPLLEAGDDRLRGRGGNDVLFGFGGNDDLRGGAGNDSLFGGDGFDLLVGAGGRDVLMGEDGNDTLDGGGGGDTLDGGDGADYLYGDGEFMQVASFYDVLNGGDGDDYLATGGGRDSLDGGAGEFDIAFIHCVYTYPTTGLSFLASDVTTPTVLVGDGTTVVNAERFSLVGGGGGDHFRTLDGFDYLDGYSGNDTLEAGGGTDVLHGGYHADRMSGGAGSDTFSYREILDSTAAVGGRDTISDFNADEDVIDFFNIDAIANVGFDDAFTFIGDGAFTAAGQLRAIAWGAYTLIEANTGGTLAPEMRILLLGQHGLDDTNFVL
jgi:Ca2+-binding RTX toxin-like protein